MTPENNTENETTVAQLLKELSMCDLDLNMPAVPGVWDKEWSEYPDRILNTVTEIEHKYKKICAVVNALGEYVVFDIAASGYDACIECRPAKYGDDSVKISIRVPKVLREYMPVTVSQAITEKELEDLRWKQCKHLSFDEVCELLEQRIEIMRELERHWRELLEKEVDLEKEVCDE